VVSAHARRSQVHYAVSRGVSTRSACALMQLSRSSLGYEARLPKKDAPVIEVMQGLSAQYPRFGYRRIHIYLDRAGHTMSLERAHRLWRLAGLQVPRRRGRKRAASGRPRPTPANGINQVWAYDFVFDACANGQQLKCLTLIDEYTREALAIDVQGSLRSGRLIEVLTQLISVRGAPAYLRSDNGPEFVSNAVLRWLKKSGIETALIDPGKPWQNGADESFNGKFRDECLNLEWFRNRVEARVIIEQWRQHYNGDRPHSSLGYRTPIEFKQQLQQSTPPTTEHAILN
jgi:putative transposase